MCGATYRIISRKLVFTKLYNHMYHKKITVIVNTRPI